MLTVETGGTPGEQRPGRRHRVLRDGARAAPGEDEHRIARRVASDVLADLDDGPRGVHADHQRMVCRVALLRRAGDEHQVERIERGGLDLDQDLVRSGRGSGVLGDGDLVQRNVVGRDKGSHRVAP